MEPFKIKKAEKLGEIPNAFQPDPLDEINLAEFYYDKTMPTRMGSAVKSPLEDLYDECTELVGTNAHLLLGHRGCGKSTELINLKRQLENDGQPVHIFRTELDANLYKVDRWDIMLFITEGLLSIAEKNNVKLPKKLVESVFDYLKKDIEEMEEITRFAMVSAEGEFAAATGLSLLIKLCASIKSSLQFGSQMRVIIREKIEKRAPEWMGYIREITDKIVTEMGGKQPILIFEGLDKIQPYERAIEVFQDHNLSKMPFPVIYTFPISLTYDPRFATVGSLYKVRILPMIKVSNEDKTKNKDGIAVMREIVKLRADLELFDKDVLEYLIKQTGGVLRHLFECIISAARFARRSGIEKISQTNAQDALSDISSLLSRQFSYKDHAALVNIYNGPSYRKLIEDEEFLLKKVHALVILEYQNGDRWHDLHPLVAKLLISQGVINVEN